MKSGLNIKIIVINCKEWNNMFGKKKDYLFDIGDTIEIHLNEGGFDNYITGIYESMDSFGVFITTDKIPYFIPLHRIVYFKKIGKKGRK